VKKKKDPLKSIPGEKGGEHQRRKGGGGDFATAGPCRPNVPCSISGRTEGGGRNVRVREKGEGKNSKRGPKNLYTNIL